MNKSNGGGKSHGGGSALAIAVVMAGGQGSRFWPVSRANRPKQFLSIDDSNESLLQATVRRVVPVVGHDHVWVVSTGALKPLIVEQVPEAHVVCEPIPRNTAACIGLAALHAKLAFPNGDPVLLVLPADHAVRNEKRLHAALREAVELASKEAALVTIGIRPTRPHTGYGYIKRGERLGGRSYRVERFFEKPSLERAEKYVESGDFAWNSGMFAWRASIILEAISEFLPEMYAGLQKIGDLIREGKGEDPSAGVLEIFEQLESISIDFGVMEHARNCYVVTAEDFGWNDVGSWDQWAENFDVDENSNLLKGDALVLDSERCVVRADKRLVAVVGLRDVVVIDAGDALLVVARESVQEVRKVVEELRRRGRTEIL